MMNAKISDTHYNMNYISKNYVLKSIYNEKNECINYMLSLSYLIPIGWIF